MIKASRSFGELKGIAKIIPNQVMLVNAIVLQEAKDSSEIENIIRIVIDESAHLICNR